jgi:hypothetical protein
MATYDILGSNSPDGSKIGIASSDKVGFLGATPISQRTGYATSLVATASSTDVTTDLKAAVIEIQNTLSLLGFWAAQA